MAQKPKPHKPTTLHEDVHELFSGPLGRRVIAGLKSRFHDKQERVIDLSTLAYAEGERNVVLLLDRYTNQPLEDLEHDAADYDSD